MRIAVLGATSGIAQECARRWSSQGADFVLLARDGAELANLAADLRIRSPFSRVEITAVDFGTRQGVEAAVRAAFAKGPVDIVLIAFGTMPSQAEADADPAIAEALLSLNGSMTLLAAHLAALELLACNGGSLVVIGSVAGDRGRRSNYLYGAAKAMVAAGVAGLQHRVAGTPVQVTLVKPGPTATRMTRHLESAGVSMAPVAVVGRDIVTAVAQHRPMVYTPRRWRYIMAVVRAMPRRAFHRTNL